MPFDWNAMFSNPMLHAGMAMLSGSMNQQGPPRNIGQIGMQGLQAHGMANMMGQQMSAQQSMVEMRKAEMERKRREEEQLRQQGHMMPGLVGGLMSGDPDTKKMAMMGMLGANPGLAKTMLPSMMAAPKESSFAEKLRMANIDPNTPEGQAFVQDIMRKPNASVNIANIPKPPSGFWYKDPTDITQGIEPMEGREIPPEQAGKKAALAVGMEQVNTVRDALISVGPEGNAVVDRKLVATMQGNVPWSEGRQKRQELDDSLQAKLRAETGAAANKEEVEKIMDRYLPSLLDSDEGIVSKMQRLEDFFSKSLQLTDPQLYQKLKERATKGGPKPWEKR